ncbi:FMN-dependent NADH-azoreductase [Lactiplantibacillus carotarum]|uniref:FMN-dependent NADH-azoreductase n=1 Tax=Lactiplantibacillus carotarum TaxID=2993456 RepID=UPI00298EFCEF|nr:NAD(P)H-dependent oxidoreductase [Lactiplantibacillus carotarum]
MTKLLMILAHPHTTTPSASLTVATSFQTAYQSAHPDDEICVRDLYTNGVPALNDTTFEAWRKQKYGQSLTPAETTILTQHAAWLDEFIAADKVVIVNPMYNHFLPAELKQYLDLTAVARKTFKYTEHGPVGLLTNKKVLHIQAAGGLYHATDGRHNQTEYGEAYLHDMMALYGVQDYQTIFIEGVDQFPDERAATIAQAQTTAETLASTF